MADWIVAVFMIVMVGKLAYSEFFDANADGKRKALSNEEMNAIQAKMAPKAEKNNRFKLTQLSQYRRDQFLLDSQTGRAWKLTCLANSNGRSGDCDVEAFLEVGVENIPASAEAYKNAMDDWKEAIKRKK